MGQVIDLTGQKFGMLTVLERDYSRKGAGYWFCICDCGNKPPKSIKASNLKSGNSKSCGCLSGKNLKEYAKDLTNQRFGSLVALYPQYNEEGRRGWICKCDCGNEKWILTAALTTGNTTSCGCHLNRTQKHIKDITGQKYGKLTAIKPDDEFNNTHKDKKKKWICKCDCGKIVSVGKTNLMSGNTLSCGCSRVSKGELRIEQVLIELGIAYQKEKAISKVIHNTDALLKFDFYLPDFNIAIEYQGEQHYEPVSIFGGEEGFKRQQRSDALKKTLCEENDVKLIIIPYWDYNKINQQFLTNLINEKE